MSINVDRSLEMPESEYFPEPQAKSGIALHHTVCHDAAHASHQDLTRRYIAELNKPRIKLPSIVGFVGAVGVGFVVGRVTQ